MLVRTATYIYNISEFPDSVLHGHPGIILECTVTHVADYLLMWTGYKWKASDCK